MTPSQAIKKKCIDCQPEPSVRTKDFCTRCALINIGKSRLKAIRNYCLWCMNGQANEVRICPSTDCIFYQYRFGHNPALKGKRGNVKSLRDYRKNAIISENECSD
jgi:hypothetical protein